MLGSKHGKTRETQTHTALRRKYKRAMLRAWVQAVLVFMGIALVSTLFRSSNSGSTGSTEHKPARALAANSKAVTGSRTLVSYSYFEKGHSIQADLQDPGQLSNFEFFQAVGMGHKSTIPAPADADFVVVISGDKCTPCSSLYPIISEDAFAKQMPQLTSGASRPGLALLQRNLNEGMDFAAHNVTIEWIRLKGATRLYRFFIFLNSSVRGPFFPSYMPPGWQWTQAYTSRLTHQIKVVSSSIVCLPEIDAGGYGAKAESWAFGTDLEGLQVLTEAGVFYLRTCKLCDDGVVVKGEYGLTAALFQHGFNIATLMSMYPVGLDWREERHWNCNSNVHPSRHGTYDGISMHPYETVFVKASWHVGEPHLSHYTRWVTNHATGVPGTAGTFDEKMYRWGVSLQAQEPNNAAACFKVI